jgi:fructose-1,6-bisphosphatase/inositol monophosphatase family enzyme
MDSRLKFMLEIIQKLGDFQHKNFRTEIRPMDTVSFVDKESEKMFIEAVNEKFSGDVVMGEESYNPNHNYSQHKKLWIIDPLDGTLMYQRGIPFYSPMIAYIEN